MPAGSFQARPRETRMEEAGGKGEAEKNELVERMPVNICVSFRCHSTGG